MSRRVDFRVSILVSHKERIKDVRSELQDLLRTNLREMLDSGDTISNKIAQLITPFPESIRVTHLREKLTWKRRLVRWLEEKIR